MVGTKHRQSNMKLGRLPTRVTGTGTGLWDGDGTGRYGTAMGPGTGGGTGGTGTAWLKYTHLKGQCPAWSIKSAMHAHHNTLCKPIVSQSCTWREKKLEIMRKCEFSHFLLNFRPIANGDGTGTGRDGTGN